MELPGEPPVGDLGVRLDPLDAPIGTDPECHREGLSSQLELLEIRVQLQQALANRARSARDVQVARKRLELLRNLPLSGGSTTTGSNP